MIYSYTLFLHLIMASFCAASLIYFINNKKSFSTTSLYYYSNWFLFYFLYNIFLVIPLLLFKEINLWFSIFYNFALVFLAFAMWFIFRMVLSFLLLNKEKKTILSNLFIVIILLITSLHFIFSEMPQGSEDKRWVFWYSNRLISFLYSSFAFIVGWLSAFSFFKEFRKISEFYLKVRSFFLFLAGFIMPFAAFLYFGAQNKMSLYLAFLLSILGLAFLLIANFVPKILKKI